ncbi:hypothetical protein BCV33_21280 [Vibrio lentus]|uniref:hypothetical protein n=1 Tax=Vibrio TaxID=662 RepID=UPI000C867802|nr:MULTISPECIES: hypothetical protein [Vibrio]PME61928.1 hypothetical protein BCV33_21280 [Vibrio lentus]
MTDRKEYMADYYEKNKTRLLEKAKKASANAAATKSFNALVSELTDSRIKLEAAMLQDVLGQMDKKLEPDHIALLWKQYKQEHKHAGFVTMSNVDDHKQPFLIWMER